MTKINVLRKKIENIEKKIRPNNKDGIPGWALEYAEKKLSSRINLYDGHLAIARELRKLGHDTEDPKPFKPHTEEDIIDLAKTVSKSASPEEYEASLPPMDITAMKKVLKALDAIKVPEK